jgi:hypothetical protein
MTDVDPPPPRHLLRVDEAQSLWRVLPQNRALKMFEHQRNCLVTPRKWDDPFENFLARCRVTLPDGHKASLGGLTAGFVGQCWTDQELETDATWRIYAPGKKRGMRIRVRAGALLDTIYDPKKPFAGLSCFLGKVVYQSERELRDWLGSVSVTNNLLDGTNVAIVETLLIKRSEFEHEAEVRLLFQDKRDRVRKSFAFDTNMLIEQVMLDPRWTRDEAAKAEKQLRCFGYRGPIQHSTLYRVPSFSDLRM